MKNTFCPSFILSFVLFGCPPGTKTSVDAGITVSVDPTCKEDRASPAALAAPPEQALLLCPTVGGTGSIHVVFPRKSWLAMKDVAAVDAGPGK